MSDDLDDNLDLGDSSFDETGKKAGGKTLGDVWRDNPLVKVGVVAVAALVIFGTIMLFGKDEKPVDPSFMTGGGSDVTAPPGTQAATPAYVAAVQEENEARIEEAQKTGSSALPTPIDPPQGRLSVPEEEVEAEDPLQRWRQLQEERLQRELQKTQRVAPSQLAEGAKTEAMQAMSEAMAQQMQSVLEKRTESKYQTMNITDPDFLENVRKKAEEDAKQNNGSANNGADGGDGFFEDEDLEGMGTVLVPAGQIAYAQLLTEANTDIEGPVLAEIVSGPLAGSRILGEFKEDNELLALNFDTVVYNGESLSIDAIALDPQTTLPGMATDVDHHYLKRIILPMAAAFVEGAAQAISESGRTTVSIQGETVAEETEEPSDKQEISSGIEEAGQELRSILDEMADDTEVTVRIETGTPLGILFLEPVIEGDEQNG